MEKLKQIINRGIKQNGPFHPVVLKENLSLMETHRLKQFHWDHPEIQVRTIEKRIYPLKENGAQILGFIGLLSKKEVRNLKKSKQIFHLGDIVGKSGLEKIYNKELKGQNGFSMVEVDAQNRISESDSSDPFYSLRIEPKKGQDVVLTIDADLQKFALKAMRREDSIGPRTGAILVMKTNGEILAMLSEPSFDPNLLSSHIDKSLWEKWSVKGSKVFINKGVQEHYSPGSVFKPFVALAALQAGVITKDTLINSPGALKIGGRMFHDYNPFGGMERSL